MSFELFAHVAPFRRNADRCFNRILYPKFTAPDACILTLTALDKGLNSGDGASKDQS